MSHPQGREAFLLAKAYVFKGIQENEDIVLDFDEVKVLTPSWAEEFIYGIQAEYTNTIQYLNTENPSIKASLKTVLSNL